jgi:hypothetical protein
VLRTSIAGFGVVAVVLSCLPGCGGGGGGGGGGAGVAAGPAISNAQILPATWSSGGGNATIQVDASDPNGVATVTATVTAPGGTTTTRLTQSSGSAHYTGQYTVPANQTVGGPAQVYSVVISATNAAGEGSSATAVEFVVPAPTQPPAPPPRP